MKRVEVENKGRAQRMVLSPLTDGQHEEALQCFDRLGETYTLNEAITFFLKHHRSPPDSSNTPSRKSPKAVCKNTESLPRGNPSLPTDHRSLPISTFQNLSISAFTPKMSRRRKSTDTTPFDPLRLEGSLFVPELLERAASGEATFQKEADYAIPKGLKLHDEYGRAFRIATATWHSFAPQTARADLDAATVTRAFAVDFLRQCLGYTDLAPLGSPIQLGDRGFPVTAQALGGRLPVIIAPHHLGLDDPDPRFAIIGSGSRKKSAHQLAQEFLNASTDSLWAIVTNGKTLRLLRDADTLTRPNFLEFDLETILRDDQHRYADFSALWRILHASRAGEPTAAPAESIWEKWKSEGHAQGLRVRDGLRDGVTEAILPAGGGPAQRRLRNHRHRQPGGLPLLHRWQYVPSLCGGRGAGRNFRMIHPLDTGILR